MDVSRGIALGDVILSPNGKAGELFAEEITFDRCAAASGVGVVQ